MLACAALRALQAHADIMLLHMQSRRAMNNPDSSCCVLSTDTCACLSAMTLHYMVCGGTWSRPDREYETIYGHWTANKDWRPLQGEGLVKYISCMTGSNVGAPMLGAVALPRIAPICNAHQQFENTDSVMKVFIAGATVLRTPCSLCRPNPRKPSRKLAMPWIPLEVVRNVPNNYPKP